MAKQYRKPRKRFDLRRRKYDGMIVKWEQKTLSELGILPEPQAYPASDYLETLVQHTKLLPAFDYEVWVITGVFKHRREAFA